MEIKTRFQRSRLGAIHIFHFEKGVIYSNWNYMRVSNNQQNMRSQEADLKM